MKVLTKAIVVSVLFFSSVCYPQEDNKVSKRQRVEKILEGPVGRNRFDAIQLNLLSHFKGVIIAEFEKGSTGMLERKFVSELIKGWEKKVRTAGYPPHSSALKMFDNRVEKALYQALVNEYSYGVLFSELNGNEKFTNHTSRWRESLSGGSWKKLGYATAVEAIRKWLIVRLDSLPNREASIQTAEAIYRLKYITRIAFSEVSGHDSKDMGLVYKRNASIMKEVLDHKEAIIDSLVTNEGGEFPVHPKGLSKPGQIYWELVYSLYTRFGFFKHLNKHYSYKELSKIEERFWQDSNSEGLGGKIRSVLLPKNEERR